jgi:hypothetical protein
MARAARPAHLAHPVGALRVAVVGVAFLATPLRTHAHAAPADDAATPPAADAAEAADEAREPQAAAEATADDAATDDPATDDAAADDAAADEVTTDDKAADAGATSANGAVGPTAAPLRPMQTAAWWTMFGAFAVGTTAGVLAGLAERQEDRATRLSTLFDIQTGAQPLYADEQREYEDYLRRGEGYAKAAIGVGVVAGVATIAAITLFAIDAKRQRGDAAAKQPRRAALRVRGGGVEVRF